MGRKTYCDCTGKWEGPERKTAQSWNGSSEQSLYDGSGSREEEDHLGRYLDASQLPWSVAGKEGRKVAGAMLLLAYGTENRWGRKENESFSCQQAWEGYVRFGRRGDFRTKFAVHSYGSQKCKASLSDVS